MYEKKKLSFEKARSQQEIKNKYNASIALSLRDPTFDANEDAFCLANSNELKKKKWEKKNT